MSSWPERYIARLRAARQFLFDLGFSIQERERNAQIPRWVVGGIRGDLGNDELVALAREYGFDPEAAHG